MRFETGRVSPDRLTQMCGRSVHAPCLKVCGAEAEVCFGRVHPGFDNDLEVADGAGGIADLQQRDGPVVACLHEFGIGFQRLAVQLHGPLWIAQLSFRLAEQREEVRVPRRLLECEVEFLAGPGSTRDVEVEACKGEPRHNERWLQSQRLTQLRDGLPHQLGRAFGAIGDAQQHVGFRQFRFHSENPFELGNRCGCIRRWRKQVGADPVQRLLDCRAWRCLSGRGGR